MMSGKGPLEGSGGATRDCLHDLACAARSDMPVLITGEHGVAARTVARTIHRRGRRADGPFVTIDCAEASDAVLESRLFGRAGAGERRGVRGFLERAHRGTMFIAHVDAMSLRLQERLHQFLEAGEVHHASADRVHARVDVRVISSAGRDLFAQGVGVSFRQDLFYRLNTMHLVMPVEGSGERNTG